MKKTVTLLFFLLLPLLLLGKHIELTQKEEVFIQNHPEIIFGVDSSWEPSVVISPDGKMYGIDKETIDSINELSGLNIKLVTGEWWRLVEKLKRKKIDGLSSSLPHNERSDFALFTDSYTSASKVIYVRKESMPAIATLADLKEKKVAILQNNLQEKKFINSLKGVNYLEFTTYEESLEALIAGSVDAMIGTELFNNTLLKYGLSSVKPLTFAGKPMDLVFSIRDDMPELASIVNKALEKLTLSQRNRIKAKYLGMTQEMFFKDINSITFTQQEKDFIKNSGAITIGSIDSYSPFSFMKNGEKVGLTQDLIEEISKRSGLEFVKVGGSWPQVFGMFKNQEIDCISELSFKEERLPFTIYTEPYYEIPIGVFTQKDFPEYKGVQSLVGKKVGIVKGSYLESLLVDNGSFEMITFDSSDERFVGLKNGEVDAVLSNAMTIYRLDSTLFLSDIKLAGIFNYQGVKKEDLRFGINKNKPLLASIMQKTLHSIEFSKMLKIKNRWITSLADTKISLTQKEKEWIDNNQVLVGIENSKPYIFFNKTNNEIDGLYGDIFKRVVQNTGLNVSYLADKNWSNLLQDFHDGAIDVLPATFYTKQREAFGFFSDDYYKVREYIYVRNESSVGSFRDLAQRKVAVVKNYGTIEKLQQIFPTIEIVPTQDLAESISLVLNKEVDALVDYHLVVENYMRDNSIVGLKGLAQSDLESVSVHLFSHIEKPILRDILQKGLRAIDRVEKNHILSKWLHTNSFYENGYALTEREKNFLDTHPTIRFRVRPNRPPFEFEKNGKPVGIAVDYIKKVAQKIGLEPKFILDNTPINESFKVLSQAQREFDTLLLATKSRDRERFLSFGESYLSYPVMIIANKNAPYVASMKDLSNKKVVLEKDFLINRWIAKDYPDIHRVIAKDTQHALEMVHHSAEFFYVGNMAIANYLNIFGGLENLKIAAPSDYGNIDYHFVAPKQWPELTSILSKGYQQISPKEHSAIQQKWFSVQYVEKFDYGLLWKILGVIAVVILWIVWWNRKLATKVEEGVQKHKTQEALLVQQSKMAAMGEMINNIAHQWRQPLNSIYIQAQEISYIVEYESSDPVALKELETSIKNQVKYMNSTIDDFRNFFKPSTKSIFRLLQAIEDVLFLIEGRLKRLDIKVEIPRRETLKEITLKGFENEFKQVILNLINNACDVFEEKGSFHNTISIEATLKSKTVVITIGDNGGGIPQELLPDKLFEPYTTTKGEKGTGIGLQMSQMIITEKFNGTIKAQNTPQGAKFIVTLPCDDESC